MRHLTAFYALFLLTILGKTQAYSQELHTQSNAANITNESNALNGWTSGNINGVVESTEVFHGNYSIKFEAPNNGSKFGEYDFTATQGESYLITISAMSTSTENPEINIRGDVVNQRYARLSSSWQTFTIPVTASGTSIRILAYPGLPSVLGNTVYVDALSITPISGTDTQAPTVPTLSSTGNTDTTVDLSFSGATDNVGVIGHMVYRNGNYFSNTDNTGTFQVKGLTANTAYTFEVRAVDADGNISAESNQISVTTSNGPDTTAPTAPTLSSTGKSSTTVDLSWSGATDDVGVTRYKVYRNGTEIAGNVTTTSYQATGLTASTTYDFKVRALDAASNESGDSNVVQVTTNSSSDTQAPTAPTSLSSSAHTDTTAELSWVAATDNVGVTGYRIYKDGVLEASPNSSPYTVTGLTAATTYSFTTTALDAAGNESTVSNAVSVTTDSSGGSGGSSVWTESGATASYTGEVAIGTTTVPTGYKMAVDGKLITEEVRVEVSNTWPDYVFQEDYDLPSLEEIKKHIEEKGHLPNIPSAQEVEANGVELGEINRLLLEKIEEMMLYILEIKEENVFIKERLEIFSKPNTH